MRLLPLLLLLILLPSIAHAECFDHVVHLPCAVARSLPGGEHAPACDEQPVHVSLRTQGDEPIDGALFEVEVERRPTTEACTLLVEVRPASERYPWCLIGDVARDDEEPAWGACCGEGCRCTGTCESVPIGPPSGYEERRLERLRAQSSSTGLAAGIAALALAGGALAYRRWS